VFVNGGCDHVIRDNHFSDTDHAIYMGGDSCYNPLELAFGNLKNVSKLLAWKREYVVGTIMNISAYSNGTALRCHCANKLAASTAATPAT